MSAIDIQIQLHQLQADRARASLGTTYAADLDEEITATRDAYVGTAVTEIATLRAELFGRQVG